MTGPERDDLNDLRAALQETPGPNADLKAAHLARAAKNFAALQGSRNAARPSSDSPPMMARLGQGVRKMLTSLTTRGGLVATTAVVALGVFLVLPDGTSMLTPNGQRDMTVSLERAPVSAPVMDIAVAEEDAVIAPLAVRPAPTAPTAKRARDGLTADMVEGTVFYGGKVSGGVDVIQPEVDTERYANAESNGVQVTTDTPVSTFSIDVDTASYAVVRDTLSAGRMPRPEMVRVEEMVNYFSYDYPAPRAEDGPFKPTVTVMPTPWNADTELVHIALQGEVIETLPPLNLVFLIDTSGSMQSPNKLPLLKSAFRMMLAQLKPDDQVAIVTYAGSSGIALEPTAASERQTILAALDRLSAGGSTAGAAGLTQAYDVAGSMTRDGAVSRVMLATDGDFNVGISDPEALKDYIAAERDSGTYLSVLGFGRGNLDDATMQALAQNGNGQASYIDTAREAQRVLVDQLGSALYPIADDVKIQVEFNPARVAEYRLIGYETRALTRTDFANDAVDAGEIGTGHQVTAIYEVTAPGSAARLSEPLRYGAVETGDATELGHLRLRYKTPGADVSQLIETPIVEGSREASEDVRFSVAVAGYGQLLRGQDLGDWGYSEAARMASGARGADAFGLRQEAVQLMRLSHDLTADQ